MIESKSIAAPADAARVCRGVPSWGGRPRVECEASIPADGWMCQRCGDEIDRRNTADAAGEARAERRRRLQAAGLSKPFVEGSKSLATVRELTPDHGAAIESALRLTEWRNCDGNTRGILLRGEPGVGKSDIAEGVIREAVIRGLAARYVNVRTLTLQLQAACRDDAPESAAAIVDRYARTLFLALDDLGATKTTRFAADSLYSILERRARNQLPTIVTTNYVSLAELTERLKPSDGDVLDAIRPTDRLEELCPYIFTLTGVSQRSMVNRWEIA